MARRASTALRGRSGLRSFPQRASTASPGLVANSSPFKFGLGQVHLETGVVLLQLVEPFGLRPAFRRTAASSGVSQLSDLDRPANVGDALALGDQLLSGFELAGDLLGCVADSFHSGIPGRVWPDEDSHSPRSHFQGPLRPGQLNRIT